MDQEEVFIQENSPNKALNHAVQGEFLQSGEWWKFQEAVGRRTFNVSGDNFYASIIEHKLPIVGRYFYVPRGPILSTDVEEITNSKSQIPNKSQNSKIQIQNLINLAEKEKAGWIRIEPADDNLLNLLRHWMSKCGYKIKKAPHDMQPKKIFVVDITKSEEELLSEMKAKTRYNIKLSQKHKISVKIISNFQFPISNEFSKSKIQNPKFYIDKFVDLVKITAKRDKITPHSKSYYRKMFETIPPEILKLYVAEYDNKIIAANIVIHYGNTVTYLHGASNSEYRNVMAPYLLQWQAIIDAKKTGCHFYDLGGVKIPKPETQNLKPNWFKKVTGYRLRVTGSDWSGITKFKTGFSPNTKPIEFPGSYDIIINPVKYYLYRILQKCKNIL